MIFDSVRVFRVFRGYILFFQNFAFVLKSFIFRRLRLNNADYKNKCKIIVVFMNYYAIVSSDEWLIEAMMKN
jgi:hypothetical protein